MLVLCTVKRRLILFIGCKCCYLKKEFELEKKQEEVGVLTWIN